MGQPIGGTPEPERPPLGDPDFPSLDEVVSLHDQQLARYGGAAGLRDAGSLASAVATPQASFGGEFLHVDLFHMAAAYAFHIAENQPFVDGNKRTGLLAALVFLDMNGIHVADPATRLYDAMLDIAAHRLDKVGLAGLLRELAATT
jgi:death-on-curing protein